jgi:hypothetical protein
MQNTGYSGLDANYDSSRKTAKIWIGITYYSKHCSKYLDDLSNSGFYNFFTIYFPGKTNTYNYLIEKIKECCGKPEIQEHKNEYRQVYIHKDDIVFYVYYDKNSDRYQSILLCKAIWILIPIHPT